MGSNSTAKNALRGQLTGKGRISARFRNMNIILFALAFCILALVLTVAFNNIIQKISADYAGRYAASSANTLSAHIVNELGLLGTAARSDALIEWLADEGNAEKKARAFGELSSIIGVLYSNNLYVGLEKTRHEYKVENKSAADDIRPFVVLDANEPQDAWYFDCITSESEYTLNVAQDRVIERKRVWLNYKVVQNGVPLGVLCTGLEFSHVAGELFSQFSSHNMRGLIIDKNGVIHIDSALMRNEEFLYNDFEAHIEKEFSDPNALSAIKSHLSNIKGYFDITKEPVAIKLPSGPYSYMTIAPIRHTDWSAVILYDSSSLFNMSLFMPATVTMLILLLVFALAVNTIGHRLIFQPLDKLERSLELLKDNHEECVYGIERDDELGRLANTILDLFTKANYDALTGIHNRRFMETSFQHIMQFLSRSNALLGVLMLDVDYFKKYNDTYGHEQGDFCLKAVAQALDGCLTRKNDFAARYGGEEFVAVLPNTDEAGAQMIAEKLLESVRALNMPHAGSLVAPYVTVSIGVATGKVGYAQSWEDYVKRADEALYASKENGRNRYTHHAV